MSKDSNTGPSLVRAIRQSPPIDTSEPYDPAWVGGKTILITGGASGFGEGFFRKWAANGANIVIGDINDKRGEAIVEEVRASTGNKNHHYIHCNVTDWQSQVDFFHKAVKLSVHGGIDAVVANAGVIEKGPKFEEPKGLDADTPPKPNLLCYDINMTGVLYTAHLALFYLPRNPRSQNPSHSNMPAAGTPDRHLLLIGSIASLGPIVGSPLYCVSKHGVLGLFRTLRASTILTGVRVNIVCPYFIDTPLIPPIGRAVLAGGATGKPEDVIDAATRMMADSRIVGRSLCIGAKVKVSADNELQLVPQTDKAGREVAIWEAFADDFEVNEIFNRRMVGLFNQIEATRGWIGWAGDIVGAFTYPLRVWMGK